MRLVKGVTSGPLRSAPAEAGLVEMLDYSLVAQRVIGLENQQVVGPARQDLLGDCGLAAHGVQRHDAVLQCELVQQFRDRCDLVRRLVNTTLAQHEALLARPGAHQVQGGSLPAAIERAPERLAIDGDHLALKAVHERADPGREPALEGIRVDQHEDAPEGVVRGNAVWQVQEGAQPRQFAAAVERDVVPALSTSDHGADCNHQNINQAMLDVALAARIPNNTEMPNQTFDGHDPLLATERARHYSSGSGQRQKFHAFALAAAEVFREAMRDTVKRYALWYLIQGVLLITAGVLAIIYPVLSSAAVIVLLGWLLIISGAVQGLSLIGARHVPHFWLQLISVILAVLIGCLFLRDPAQGLATITLLLIVFFMIESISKVVFALTIRPFPTWGWVLASGLVGILLALILWANLPVTALWLVGVLLGINLISVGAAIGYLAWQVRQS